MIAAHNNTNLAVPIALASAALAAALAGAGYPIVRTTEARRRVPRRIA